MIEFHVRYFATRDWGVGRDFGLGVKRGGPLELLRELELRFGVPVTNSSTIERTKATALALKGRDIGAKNFERDPWGYAESYLRLRDELELASPTPLEVDGNPWMEEIAKISVTYPGVPDRLAVVAKAIGAAATAASKFKVVADLPLKEWPKRWQAVLKLLTLRDAETGVPRYAATLHLDRLSGAKTLAKLCKPGDTIWVDPQDLPSVLLQLSRSNIPLAPNPAAPRDHPNLMLLPLMLRLSYYPVNAYWLHDFLSLPESPIPAGLRKSLRRVLGNETGFGGPNWVDAVEREKANYAEKGWSSRGFEFLESMGKISQNEVIPPSVCESIVTLIRSWAKGKLEDNLEADSLQRQLEFFQAMASVEKINRTSLDRILRRLQELVPLTREPRLAVGGVIVTTDFYTIGSGRVLMFNPTQLPREKATHDEGLLQICRRQFGVAPHEVSPRAESKILELVLDKPSEVFVIRVDEALDPLIEHRLKGEVIPDQRQGLELASEISYDSLVELLEIPPIEEFPSASASQLEWVIKCPLRAYLASVLKIKEGSSAPLSAPALLVGNYAHHVVERVIRENRLQKGESAWREIFAADLAAFAEPLTRPEMATERRRALTSTFNALNWLLENRAEWDIRAEVPLELTIGGFAVRGKADLLLTKGIETEVLDLKTSGKEREMHQMEAGISPQLIAYAKGTGGVTRIGFLFGKSGQCEQVEGERLDLLKRETEKLLTAELNRIKSGRITLRPTAPDESEGALLAKGWAGLVSGNSPCTYCEFKTVCTEVPE